MKKFDGQETQRVQFVESVKTVNVSDTVSELKTLIDIPYTDMPVGTTVTKLAIGALSYNAKRYGITFKNSTDISIVTTPLLYDSSATGGLGNGHEVVGKITVPSTGVNFFYAADGVVADSMHIRFPVGDTAPTKGNFIVQIREVV